MRSSPLEPYRNKWENIVHTAFRLLEEADEDYEREKIEVVSEYLILEARTDSGLSPENEANLRKLLETGREQDLSKYSELEQLKEKYLDE